MSAMPTDTDALTHRPARDTGTERVDDTGDFMTGNARILDARPQAFLGHGVAVADAAGLNLYPCRTGAGLRNIAFDNFKGSLGASNLSDAHL